MSTHVPVQGKIVLDAPGLGRTLSRIAHEIIEGNPALEELALVGIQTRGVPLAQRLARLIESRPGPRPMLVAESGIHCRADVERLVCGGASAILVGESLMKEGDVRGKVKELMGR